MATKVFWLRPTEEGRWHSPEEVVGRLTKVFDHVSADREEARILGENFIRTYRKLLGAGLGFGDSTPLHQVEHQWSEALVLRARDDSGATAPFEVVVRTEDTLELRFPSKTPFQKKRRSAEKVAKALGYAIEHFDPER